MLANAGFDTKEYIYQYQLHKVIQFEDKNISDDKPINFLVDPSVVEPYEAEWKDLCRLHHLVLSRRVTTILEFGLGKSTSILAHALKINQERHGEYVKKHLRRNNPFELHSVDDMQRYIDITRDAMPEELRAVTTFYHSLVEMGEFCGRICTYYQKLPNICPDFIYLDGPAQSSVKGEIAGISTNHFDRVPMAADILRFEHFLLPGTLIVVDGRTANARFLKANLQRNWHYQHMTADDIHYFELIEPPLGIHNQKQINYCLGNEWLEKVYKYVTAI